MQTPERELHVQGAGNSGLCTYFFYGLRYDRYCQCRDCRRVSIASDIKGELLSEKKNMKWLEDKELSNKIINEAIIWNKSVAFIETSKRFLYDPKIPRREKQPVLRITKP